MEKNARPISFSKNYISKNYFSKNYKSISYIPFVNLESGHYLSQVCQLDLVFKNKFAVNLDNCFYLFTDGSKQMEARFTVISPLFIRM